jgi:hypothetical protein
MADNDVEEAEGGNEISRHPSWPDNGIRVHVKIRRVDETLERELDVKIFENFISGFEVNECNTFFDASEGWENFYNHMIKKLEKNGIQPPSDYDTSRLEYRDQRGKPSGNFRILERNKRLDHAPSLENILNESFSHLKFKIKWAVPTSNPSDYLSLESKQCLYSKISRDIIISFNRIRILQLVDHFPKKIV